MTQSLHDLPMYVTDAFLLVPARPFYPEQTVLGFYTFLPWARTGIAQGVVAPTSGIRAGSHVHVAVHGGGRSVDVGQDLLVRGPGDVLAISSQQVIRKYPEDGHTKVEESFLAHVELDRPDYPWIFSPAAPQGDRLVPWLSLVVLRASRSTLFPAADNLPAHVQTTMSELQPLEDAWAWAHAQVAGPVAQDDTTASVADRLTDQYGAQNLSRIVCPRRLVSDQTYLACLVPTYDAGVHAGLGSPEDGSLDLAWHRDPSGADADTTVDLPVYLSWTFSTGPQGDFLSLAEKLVAQPAPWQVGRRLLDTSEPGGGLPALADDAAGRLQTVLAPLFSPQAPDPVSPDPIERAAAVAEAAEWPEQERLALVEIVNAPDALAGGGGDDASLPLLGPELYGRHQAARTRVSSDGSVVWFDQLNTRPVDRVAAGLGTRVVQRDQEELMQSAWAQVGAVDAVNAALRLAELARFAGESLHTRFLGPLGYGSLLQVTRGIHARVKVASAVTLASTVQASSLAAAAVTSTFRRATRPLGPLARWTGGDNRTRLASLLGDQAAPRDFQRPYRELDGVTGLAEDTARALSPEVVARHLDIAPGNPDVIAHTLVDRASGLAGTSALADAVTPDAVRGARPDPSFQMRPEVSRILVDAVDRTSSTALVDPTAALTHLRMLQSMGPVPIDVSQRVHDMSVELDRHLPGVLQRSLPNQIQFTNPDPPLTMNPGVLPGLQPFSRLHVLPAGAPRAIPPAEGTPAWAAAVDLTQAEIELQPDVRLQVALRLADLPLESIVPAVLPLAQDLVTPAWPVTPGRPTIAVTGADLLAGLHPGLTLSARMLGRIGVLPSWLPRDWFDDGRVRPVMAAPTFPRPMYQALNALDPEWLLPGLGLMPEPDLVTVLVINGRFLEGFLVGLSHEMGRELLWRGYPTDQAGTYFKRFFNAAADELTAPIHQFAETSLGSHLVGGLDGRVVLLVRGELLRRFPDAMVLAMRADHRDATGHPVFSDVTRDPSSQAAVLFHGHLPPDTTLVGFDLTADMVRAEDWWFVIAEHPTAPRFGLAESRGVPLSRDSVAWSDLPAAEGNSGQPVFLSALSQVDVPDQDPAPPVTWGRDAGTGAHLLLRNPVRAAFDARKLLGKAGAV
ncbi:MAG: hypothetical protein M3Z50_13615 [Actinomycetota bacterium]|nr:hypothetical protein [Actinomycetota bacterium]